MSQILYCVNNVLGSYLFRLPGVPGTQGIQDLVMLFVCLFTADSIGYGSFSYLLNVLVIV